MHDAAMSVEVRAGVGQPFTGPVLRQRQLSGREPSTSKAVKGSKNLTGPADMLKALKGRRRTLSVRSECQRNRYKLQLQLAEPLARQVKHHGLPAIALVDLPAVMFGIVWVMRPSIAGNS